VSFSGVRGQGAAVEVLRAALKSGRLAHAYLFTGPPGVGKRTLAAELVKAVLCEKKVDDACDACSSCRAIGSGNSWEFSTIGVEESKGAFRPVEDTDREIKVGSVRLMEREISVKTAEGRTRAVLIPRAERMNEEAQNALLKTLEEPAGSRLLILTTSRPEALLPTVISRLARVRLRPLALDEVAAHLREARGMSRSEAEEVATASAGSIGAALAADLENVRAARTFAEERLASPTSARSMELAESMMAFARERSSGGRGLEPVRRGLLDLMRTAAAMYRGELWRALGAGGGEESVAEVDPVRRRLEAVLRAEGAIAGYASPELVCRVLAGELADN
jgi:DNA polymerase-3 subunit delta'